MSVELPGCLQVSCWSDTAKSTLIPVENTYFPEKKDLVELVVQHAGGEAAGQQQGGAYFEIVASPHMTGIAQERRRGWAPACQARGPGRMAASESLTRSHLREPPTSHRTTPTVVIGETGSK